VNLLALLQMLLVSLASDTIVSRFALGLR